ncbi:hypothetical protein NPX13_g8794 [Xylaria arbuscula]|uniref:Uncharacterized protein n=1 Tax=Xylaria arbuscula TaxID=114810 RepID=A0A9W8TIA2_9PEZI|nr:hypothetical protein NPX13_g8794 [Xylaria arbuscula]
MTTLFTPFFASSRRGDAWFFAGLKSSFPNLDKSGVDIIHEAKPCENGESVPGCKVFSVPASDSSKAEQVEGDDMILHDGVALQDQVLIFQYKGRVHAVDNWEVELRPVKDKQGDNEDAEEVWVRRKQRLG